jgi:hypothetical protein
MFFPRLRQRLGLDVTHLYCVGIGLVGMVLFLDLLVPPPNIDIGNTTPPPIISGTALPAMMNSPDTLCAGQRRCTDAEFDNLVDGLQRQWAITPEWVRLKCRANATFPSMEQCIRHQTGSWVAENPYRQAPWLDPENVGAVAKYQAK